MSTTSPLTTSPLQAKKETPSPSSSKRTPLSPSRKRAFRLSPSRRSPARLSKRRLSHREQYEETIECKTSSDRNEINECVVCWEHRNLEAVSKQQVISLLEKAFDHTCELTNIIQGLYPELVLRWMEGVDLLCCIPEEKGFWEGCSICCCLELLENRVTTPFLTGLWLAGETVWFERCLDGIEFLGASKDVLRKFIGKIVNEMK
jgi:hypothetical protein